MDLESVDLDTFKNMMFNYYLEGLGTSYMYNPDDPRTHKTICLKYNAARPLNHPISCCM